jgi:hypothetical protein
LDVQIVEFVFGEQGGASVGHIALMCGVASLLVELSMLVVPPEQSDKRPLRTISRAELSVDPSKQQYSS